MQDIYKRPDIYTQYVSDIVAMYKANRKTKSFTNADSGDLTPAPVKVLGEANR